MLEIHIIPNFVKINRVVLEIYWIYVQGQNDRQTDNPIFYKVETYLDRLLVPEIYKIPNFVKIVREVLEIYVSYVNGQTDRQATRFLQCWDLARSSCLARNMYNTKSCENLVRAVFQIYESCVHEQTDR